MSDSSQGFTFFSNSSPKEISQKDEPLLQYIVIQNDFLHQRVAELEKQIKELSQEKEQLEEDNERIEKSITALRGITFNECEMSKLLENVIKGYKDVDKIYNKAIREYCDVSFVHYYIVATHCLLAILTFIDPLIIFYLMAISILTFNAVVVSSIDENIKKNNLPSIYEEKEREYYKLRKNQEYITTMIESM